VRWQRSISFFAAEVGARALAAYPARSSRLMNSRGCGPDGTGGSPAAARVNAHNGSARAILQIAERTRESVTGFSLRRGERSGRFAHAVRDARW
jgi:hypothetical protein